MSKKKEVPEEKILLGRPSNNLKIGIVGLPNVGKSTLFNILTKLSVPAENFPFCTIEPNEARVNVPDDRFEWLCSQFKPASRVPAFLSITDIAGLIRGASTGEGLGNAFLSHIRATDGIMEVVRIFEDADITHVEGAIDPVRDLEIITQELIAKDLESVEKAKDQVLKNSRHVKVDKKFQARLDLFDKLTQMLNAKIQIRSGDWKISEIEELNQLQLLTAKPVFYIINMSESDYIKKGSKWLGKIKAWVDANGGGTLVPFCGKIETELLDLPSDEERAKYCESKKVQSAIPKIIKTGYDTLQLIYFFTCGADEVKCWTIRRGTKAPQAAGVIHSDFEKGFICAEVMRYEDLKELGSESAVKAAGKYRQEGKGYTVNDGDIIFFKANTVGLKK